jgi:hypothetical protein
MLRAVSRYTNRRFLIHQLPQSKIVSVHKALFIVMTEEPQSMPSTGNERLHARNQCDFRASYALCVLLSTHVFVICIVSILFDFR